MRELNLNGYIDSEIWWGDEITPESLHEMLYGPNNEYSDDVHIRLNSYGGDCNAATRMHDDVVAYPGRVDITVSGTAASAATVLAMSAQHLDMTPGSLFMIHDPSVMACGNEHDLMDAINLLRACKESIINVYGKRCRKPREEIGNMMAETTWMDAQTALANGFIDAVAESPVEYAGPTNAATNRSDAERMVNAWIERHDAKNTNKMVGVSVIGNDGNTAVDAPADDSAEPSDTITEDSVMTIPAVSDEVMAQMIEFAAQYTGVANTNDANFLTLQSSEVVDQIEEPETVTDENPTDSGDFDTKSETCEPNTVSVESLMRRLNCLKAQI